MNDKKVEVTLELINVVLNYLGTKPYSEVVQLVQALHQQVGPQVQKPEDQSAQTVQ